jgi:DNA modification methylase
VSLGRKGRYRTNLWTYPGASSLGSDARKGLEVHPTVKPVAMLADAILDVTDRGDMVFDPFSGSGSTLIAAHRTGRIFRGSELDPVYHDVILRRWIELTGEQPVLEATGQSFSAIADRNKE